MLVSVITSEIAGKCAWAKEGSVWMHTSNYWLLGASICLSPTFLRVHNKQNAMIKAKENTVFQFSSSFQTQYLFLLQKSVFSAQRTVHFIWISEAFSPFPKKQPSIADWKTAWRWAKPHSSDTDPDLFSEGLNVSELGFCFMVRWRKD